MKTTQSVDLERRFQRTLGALIDAAEPTQTEIAAAAGLSARKLSNLRTGDIRANIPALVALADVFGVEPAFWFQPPNVVEKFLEELGPRFPLAPKGEADRRSADYRAESPDFPLRRYSIMSTKDQRTAADVFRTAA